MENASKALIMAAEVLLGVMLISVGVYIFELFGSYSKETSDKITDAQIAEFNNQFLKYYGQIVNDETGKDEPIKCTIHEIASLANFAKKNNSLYEVENQSKFSDSSFYIQIDMKNLKNIEKYTESQLIQLIKNNDLVLDEDGKKTKTKYFKCLNYNISEKTKRVNYVQFVEI